MHREHITPLTLVFKDTHIEDKVHVRWFWCGVWREEINECCDVIDVFLRFYQFSQMRDEMFNSNLVCSFIMFLFLMAAQALIPAPR